MKALGRSAHETAEKSEQDEFVSPIQRSLNTADVERWRAGRDAWNSWSEQNPGRKVSFAGYAFPPLAEFRGFIFPGPVDFAHCNFAGDADFADTQFGGDANFHRLSVKGNANFQRAQFDRHAFFDRASFAGEAVFSGAFFSQRSSFPESIFRGPAFFDNCAFKDDAWFDTARFAATADFSNTHFGNKSFFERVQFQDNANFRYSVFDGVAEFKDARFGSSAEFRKSCFHGNAWFNEAIFSGDAWFPEARFSETAWFSGSRFSGDAWFRHATFCRRTGFSDSQFEGNASFEAINSETSFSIAGTCFFNVPEFGEARFSKAPRLDNLLIKPPSVAGRSERDDSAKYRVLRGLAIDGHDHENEREFFAREIRTRRFWMDKPWQTRFWFGIAYDLLSNFGRSLARPLFWWFVSTLAFAAVYLQLQGAGLSKTCEQNTARPVWEALYVSSKNALPIIGGERTGELNQSFSCLYGGTVQVPIIPFSVSFLQLLQSAWSALLLFLFLLAFRNLFRIK